MSGPYGDFHGLRTEIGDLSAVLDASGARYVFGLSAGAVIAIETASRDQGSPSSRFSSRPCPSTA